LRARPEPVSDDEAVFAPLAAIALQRLSSPVLKSVNDFA